MTLHFIHVGKTGGTAIKRALREQGAAYWNEREAPNVRPTKYGPIQLHHHSYGLREVPADDYVFFCVRDPVSRFLSGFYSRLNKGQPRYYAEWTPAEREAFEAFPTPQQLAAALAGEDPDARLLAEQAMRRVRHLRPMTRSVGRRKALRARLEQVAYIGRQETLTADWERMKDVLGLPDEVQLPASPVRAHVGDASLDTSLDEAAVTALREWYRRDYRLLKFSDRVRRERGWTAEPPRTQPARPAPRRWLRRR
jgi:hypothetical protein